MCRTIEMYGGRVFGKQVTSYGLEHGYLDYQTLAEIVGDCILNNTIRAVTYPDDWELVAGWDRWGDEEEIEYFDIYQDFIISESGYEFLKNYTDEIVYYNEELDVYIWAITHLGTAWSHVLTDIKLVEIGGDLK